MLLFSDALGLNGDWSSFSRIVFSVETILREVIAGMEGGEWGRCVDVRYEAVYFSLRPPYQNQATAHEERFGNSILVSCQ